MVYKKNKIRDFIVDNVSDHPKDIINITARNFGVSKQAVHRHINILIRRGVLEAEDKTKSRKYTLKPIVHEKIAFFIHKDLAEDKIWRLNISNFFKNFSPNIIDICHQGFTEIFNNVIDHSNGMTVRIVIKITSPKIEIKIIDNGIGIFTKIKNELGLEDERHAILELSKGKLTTDPEKHSGEGIFFTSRIFDEFLISSKQYFFSHYEDDDWLLELDNKKKVLEGTIITMAIKTNSKRTTKEVFDRYASESDDYGFTRTHVPVALAQYGEENLVSRSQAKRLLARFDTFKEVFLDFKDVKFIGQAFTDEIFRVFRNNNTNIRLILVNTNEYVEKMIQRVVESGEFINKTGEKKEPNYEQKKLF
tara:strand:- start:266 stop:1354 length:1089 start_codon:yes stop_codon:yes gene_type:complete